MWAALAALCSVKSALFIGLGLLAASAPPLWQMGREVLSEREALRRFSVDRLAGSLSATFSGHTVKVSDALLESGADPRSHFEQSPVRIDIDGVDRSSKAELRIATRYTDAARYWGYLRMGELLDLETGECRLFVVQCLPRDGARAYPRSLSWRVLFVDAGGGVTEDVFGFDERAEPPWRTLVARTASPAGLGFHSQVLATAPGGVFPALYPVATSVLGLALALVPGLLRGIGRERALRLGQRLGHAQHPR
jgi:hypothetical protein